MKEQFKAVLFLFFVSVFHHQFKKIYIFLKKICNLKSESYNNVVIERQHITKIYFISYKTSKWQQSTNHLLLRIQWHQSIQTMCLNLWETQRIYLKLWTMMKKNYQTESLQEQKKKENRKENYQTNESMNWFNDTSKSMNQNTIQESSHWKLFIFELIEIAKYMISSHTMKIENSLHTMIELICRNDKKLNTIYHNVNSTWTEDTRKKPKSFFLLLHIFIFLFRQQWLSQQKQRQSQQEQEFAQLIETIEWAIEIWFMICFIIEQTLNSMISVPLLNLIARIQTMKQEDTRFDFQAKELSRDVRECFQNDTMKSFRLIRNDSVFFSWLYIQQNENRKAFRNSYE